MILGGSSWNEKIYIVWFCIKKVYVSHYIKISHFDVMRKKVKKVTKFVEKWPKNGRKNFFYKNRHGKSESTEKIGNSHQVSGFNHQMHETAEIRP